MAKSKTKPAAEAPAKVGEVIAFPVGIKADATRLEAMVEKINRAHFEGLNAFGLYACQIGHMLNQLKNEVAKAAFKWDTWCEKLSIERRTVEKYMQLGHLFKAMPALPETLASGQKIALLSIDEMLAVGVEAEEKNADPIQRLKDAILYKTAVVAVKKAAEKREAAAKGVVKAKAKAEKAARPGTKAKRAAKIEEAEEELETADAEVEKAESELKKIPVKYKAKPVQNRWSIPKIDDQAYALIGLRVERDCVFAAPYVAYALGLTATVGGPIKLEKSMLQKLLVKLADVHKKDKAAQDTHDKREACRAYFAGE